MAKHDDQAAAAAAAAKDDQAAAAAGPSPGKVAGAKRPRGIAREPEPDRGRCHYVANGTVQVGAGELVALDKRAAARRGRRLEAVEGRQGWYRARETLQVKRGEAFSLAAPIAKGQGDRVDEVAAE